MRSVKKEALTPAQYARRRMGPVSWDMLGVLVNADPQALDGSSIRTRLDAIYQDTDYPVDPDPSSINYSLKRMLEIGVIQASGSGMIPINKGKGRVHIEQKDLYMTTALGKQIFIARNEYLRTIFAQHFSSPAYNEAKWKKYQDQELPKKS